MIIDNHTGENINCIYNFNLTSFLGSTYSPLYGFNVNRSVRLNKPCDKVTGNCNQIILTNLCRIF
jgi:hypothetical protein